MRKLSQMILTAVLILGIGFITGCGGSDSGTPASGKGKDGGASRPRPEDGTPKKKAGPPVLND